MMLLVKYWREAGIAVLFLVLVGYCQARDRAKVAEGQAQERYRVADSTLRVIKPQLAHTDTVLVRDTIRLTRLVPALQVIHDTLLRHLTDTVLVRQFIEKADSTVQACTDLLSSCTLFRRQATATIAALEAKAAAIPAAAPRSCVATGALWTVLGAGVGFLGAKIGR